MADQKERVQVELIREALGDVVAWPLNWAEDGQTVEYFFRRDTLLTRTRDVGRVSSLLREIIGEFTVAGTRSEGQSASGVAALRWAGDGDDGDRSVLRVLERLERALGVGVVRPEHLMYVCGYPCPAAEPEPVDPATAPTSRFPSPPQASCGCDCHCGRRCDCQCRKGDGSGKGMSIGIVDTGLDPESAVRHVWMQGVTGEPDGAVGGGLVGAYGGHGTFSAGCARVTAPDADVFVASALPYAGAAYETELGDAIERLLDVRVPDVLVFTFVTSSYRDLGPMTFEDLYERRLRHLKGLAILSPAGNDGWSTPMFPAAFPWVTSVGALSADCASRASYSNHGTWVDVSVPGTDLINAFPKGDFTCVEPPNSGVRIFTGMARWSGTSFSTPLFAGMVAARASARGTSAAVARDELLSRARQQSLLGVGPVLVPGS